MSDHDQVQITLSLNHADQASLDDLIDSGIQHLQRDMAMYRAGCDRNRGSEETIEFANRLLRMLRAALTPQPAPPELSAASAPTDGVSDAELTEAVEQFGWARQHLGRWYERDPHDPRATRQEQVARTEQTSLMTMIRAAMRAAQEGR